MNVVFQIRTNPPYSPFAKGGLRRELSRTIVGNYVLYFLVSAMLRYELFMKNE
jgi:hypothetical protein